eukprot:jgi/Mesvir1/20479/Mv12366-RA.1
MDSTIEDLDVGDLDIEEDNGEEDEDSHMVEKAIEEAYTQFREVRKRRHEECPAIAMRPITPNHVVISQRAAERVRFQEESAELDGARVEYVPPPVRASYSLRSSRILEKALAPQASESWAQPTRYAAAASLDLTEKSPPPAPSDSSPENPARVQEAWRYAMAMLAKDEKEAEREAKGGGRKKRQNRKLAEPSIRGMGIGGMPAPAPAPKLGGTAKPSKKNNGKTAGYSRPESAAPGRATTAWDAADDGDGDGPSASVSLNASLPVGPRHHKNRSLGRVAYETFSLEPSDGSKPRMRPASAPLRTRSQEVPGTAGMAAKGWLAEDDGVGRGGGGGSGDGSSSGKGTDWSVALVSDVLQRVADANACARQLALSTRYRTRVEGSRVVVQAYEVGDAGEGGRPSSGRSSATRGRTSTLAGTSTPLGRDMSVDVFLATCDRLHVQAGKLLLSKARRGNGPAVVGGRGPGEPASSVTAITAAGLVGSGIMGGWASAKGGPYLRRHRWRMMMTCWCVTWTMAT